MENLTPREEHVMQLLWKLKEAVVKDIILEFPEPRPPYTTISSIVRILETKGYVGHKAYGKTHVYHPLVTRDDFRKRSLKRLMNDYFSGSYERVVSFMVEEENLDANEIEKLKAIIEEAEKREGGSDE